MKPVSSFITLFFICAVFFFLGFFWYANFYRIVLPDVQGIQYQMDLAQVISDHYFFAVIMAAVPLFLSITWQVIPLRNIDKKILSALMVLICMAGAVYIQHIILVSEFTTLAGSASNNMYDIAVPFEQVAFEWCLLAGLVAGCIITFLAFHNRIIRRQILRS
jgi:hypothetical protein